MKKNKIIIFSGAGLDADSGIPTFRDKNGLWENYSIDQVCNINTFHQNYKKIHEFYNKMRVSLKDYEPNKAHYFISDLQKKYGKDRVISLTANISDLQEKAGVEDVIHVHGDLKEIIHDYKGINPEIKNIGYEEVDISDTLQEGGFYEPVIKPNVIFFGENAPEYISMMNVFNDLTKDDVVIAVGTTLEINPIHLFISQIGVKFIIINPELLYRDPMSPHFTGEFTELTRAAMIATKNISKKAFKGFEEIESYLDQIMS